MVKINDCVAIEMRLWGLRRPSNTAGPRSIELCALHKSFRIQLQIERAERASMIISMLLFTYKIDFTLVESLQIVYLVVIKGKINRPSCGSSAGGNVYLVPLTCNGK